MPLNVSHKQLVSRFAKQHDISSRKAENIFRSVDKNIMSFSSRKIGSEKKAKEILDRAYQAASEQGITLKGYSAGARQQRNKFISELKKEQAATTTKPSAAPAKTTQPKAGQEKNSVRTGATAQKLTATPKDENVYKTGEYGHRQAKYTEAELKKDTPESGARESMEMPAANRADNQKTSNKITEMPI